MDVCENDHDCATLTNSSLFAWSYFWEMEQAFIRSVNKLDHNLCVTYAYWATITGIMACSGFDRKTNFAYVQVLTYYLIKLNTAKEVRMLPDGSLSNQFEWELDSNFENSSYPLNGTDMGTGICIQNVL